MVAAALGGVGFGGGADGGQAGVPGSGADLAELVADPLRRPGGFDGVGVAQVQQPPVGHAAHVGAVDGPRAAKASCQAARGSGVAAAGSGPIGSVGWS